MRQLDDVPAVTLLALERREWPEGQHCPPGEGDLLLVAQLQLLNLLGCGTPATTFRYHLDIGMTRAGTLRVAWVDATPYELSLLREFNVITTGAKAAKLVSLPLAARALHSMGLLTPNVRRQLEISSTAGLTRAVPLHHLQLQQWQQQQQQAGAQLMEISRPFSYSGGWCGTAACPLHECFME